MHDDPRPPPWPTHPPRRPPPAWHPSTHAAWPGIFLSGNGCRLTVSLYLASCGPSQPSKAARDAVLATHTPTTSSTIVADFQTTRKSRPRRDDRLPTRRGALLASFRRGGEDGTLNPPAGYPPPPRCLVSNKFSEPNCYWGPRGPRQGNPCVPLLSPFGRNRLSSTQHGLGLILRESSET